MATDIIARALAIKANKTLPAISSADAGKLATVDSNGKWAAANLTVGQGEVAVDSTLLVSGAAADAKVTGDKVNELKSAIKVDEKYLIGNENLITGASWTSGYRITADGTIVEQVNFAYSDPIAVASGTSYKYVDNASRSDLYTYVLGYNNNTFVAALTSLSGTTGIRNAVFTVPSTVNAIRVSHSDYNMPVCLAESKTIQDKIDNISGQIDTNALKTVSGFNAQTAIGGYVDSSGNFVSAASGWERTDYIETVPGAVCKASLKGYSTNPIVAFYDADKVYMSEASVKSNSQLVVDVNTTVPNGVKYAVFVSQTTYADAGYEIQVPATIGEAVNKLIEDETLYKGVKVLCLGDSLTAGRDGSGNILQHNYPYYMQDSRLKGCTILNYGVVGSTSKTYWNSHINNVPFDETIDVILCMWGTNGGLVDTSALATDVEPYDNYEDYADTGVGCYCKIIEYAMEQTQNNAQIILLTPPYNGDASINSRVIKAQPVVKQIAERYNLPVIDMFKCGIGAFNYSKFMPVDSVHFSEEGYEWIGKYIGGCADSVCSKID